MTLSYNDVILNQIRLEDIELLRNWRNDPKITERMFFRDFITEEMQLNWFLGLKATDFHFIIKYKNEPIGLISLNNELDGTAQVGLFIHNDTFWGGPIPIFASLALLKFAFEKRKLQKVYAKVLDENIIAQKYNKNLGFGEMQNSMQILTIENYKKTVCNLINKFKKK